MAWKEGYRRVLAEQKRSSGVCIGRIGTNKRGNKLLAGLFSKSINQK